MSSNTDIKNLQPNPDITPLSPPEQRHSPEDKPRHLPDTKRYEPEKLRYLLDLSNHLPEEQRHMAAKPESRHGISIFTAHKPKLAHSGSDISLNMFYGVGYETLSCADEAALLDTVDHSPATQLNPDVSTGPLARPFARGTVNDWMAI